MLVRKGYMMILTHFLLVSNKYAYRKKTRKMEIKIVTSNYH